MNASKKNGFFNELEKENISGLSGQQYLLLKKVIKTLGYSDFISKEQGLITLKFFGGENVFGVLPTSGGKSFTFQTVARLTDGITLVVSPLISLMKDQAGKHKDGKVAYFNSDLKSAERHKVIRKIKSGQIKLLYVSPERLKSSDFKEILFSGKKSVKRLVIDEAHCIIEWGYSFRVKYLHIAREIERFEGMSGHKIPVLLLTATASPWLQREIVEKLGIRIPDENFITQQKGAERPELDIRVWGMKSDRQKINWIVKQLKPGGLLHKKRGIIFSAFADGGENLKALKASDICDVLKVNGIRRIDYYHGGLPIETRRKTQEKFQSKKTSVLIATKAFGMGVDLPKLDFIIHFYPPISIEEYWQEAGRGGRGMDIKKGERCRCFILHDPDDFRTLQGFPNLASFEKILSTYMCIVQGEVVFNREKIKLRGKLRKLLDFLKQKKDLEKIQPINISNIHLERWKLRKGPAVIIKHIETLIRDHDLNSKQTRRLRNILRLRAARSGKTIRIEHRNEKSGPGLEYYDTELNWFTEPEIGALEMMDDLREGHMLYSQFHQLKEKITMKEIKILMMKINDFRDAGYAKLNFVFEQLLMAKRGREKQVILDYLEYRRKSS